MTVPVPGVLANDSDPDGDPLTTILVGEEPCYGTLPFNSDGSFTYVPAPDFRGMDSFVYQASDGKLESRPTTVMIDVGVPPIAVDDTYEVDENTTLIAEAPGVLANDDTSSGPLEALLVDGPANGTVSLNADGSFTYTPNADFSGLDTFVYSAFLPIEKEGVRIDLGPEGSLDARQVRDPDIIKLLCGQGFRMYYAGHDDIAITRILSAVSTDGLTWVKENGIRLQNRPDQGELGTPEVVPLPDGTYRIYYI